MAWDYETSKKRIQQHLDSMGDIEVKKLVREAKLDDLLTETCCREIYGSHVYLHVSNFAKLASEEIDDSDRYKGFIRAVHIYQREVGRIIQDEAIFNAVRVHFQGPKAHALIYRPIDNAEKISAHAILLELVVKDFVSSVFNPAFPDYDNFRIAGGADIGNAIGTRNGEAKDRELLFLGAPANHAAKIINSHGQLRLTKRVYDELPDDIQGICDEVTDKDDIYQVQHISQAKLDALTKSHGIGWDREASKKRVEADKESFPLTVVEYSSANQLIDVDDLSIRKNKRVMAASVYGDVTGFTAYIDAATTDEAKKERLREFHVIRKEMAAVVRRDFNGIRIQFQGDRVQGIIHLPKDDETGVATEATDTAAGLQASMERSLKDCLPNVKKKLNLAAGVDQGTTLITKLGTRGHRDRICLGEPVDSAASMEEKCEGKETGVSKRVYDALPDRLKKQFSYDSDRRYYVAADLTSEDPDGETTKQAAAVQSPAPYILRHDGRSA
ncbi:transcriptional regulator [Capsulimonas corticalis]|uniref:Transcriptional regulator n=1 Tax=Capsulimonas corticalis TaxID=2219043 RepID=A0A402D674_9BACT|nr:adenylate/guanylate cyclase domain-containing protein [Capsulimonas corticalis]BDI31494.1 transcriptional regulator [Capsulimonas corticalis]